jgi:hypothetical protein
MDVANSGELLGSFYDLVGVLRSVNGCNDDHFDLLCPIRIHPAEGH